MCYAAVGVLRAVLGGAMAEFFPHAHGGCMPELCHPLIYGQAVPFLSFMSVLFANMVQQRIITGSSALAFLVSS